MKRYYSTQRPVMPGGFPEKGKVENIVNFDKRKYCAEIESEAWGYIDYKEPLTEKQASDYELVPYEERVKVIMTPGIKSLILESENFTEFVAKSVARHINHDWGELDSEDKAMNDQDPEMAMSAYTYRDELTIWVKSENGYIVVLLPSEH
ncbi:MAG: hypothetical protein K2L82_14180 [Lachnospiraceae bacterium]|nr:hypothetical protein [Lachnospiraceae bacterium]